MTHLMIYTFHYSCPDNIVPCLGDGIYSLTITDYPSQGRYKFTISTDDNDKKAHVIDKFGKQSKMFRSSGLRSLEVWIESSLSHLYFIISTEIHSKIFYNFSHEW